MKKLIFILSLLISLLIIVNCSFAQAPAKKTSTSTTTVSQDSNWKTLHRTYQQTNNFQAADKAPKKPKPSQDTAAIKPKKSKVNASGH